MIKNAAGEVVELRCTYDPATKGGNAPDGRKVKATMHWVSAAESRAGGNPRLQSSCSPSPSPDAGEFRRRPQSAVAGSADRRADRAARRPTSNSAEVMQFERQGYFVRDRDSTPGKPVFNRTIGLRDTFAKEVGGKG